MIENFVGGMKITSAVLTIVYSIRSHVGCFATERFYEWTQGNVISFTSCYQIHTTLGPGQGNSLSCLLSMGMKNGSSLQETVGMSSPLLQSGNIYQLQLVWAMYTKPCSNYTPLQQTVDRS